MTPPNHGGTETCTSYTQKYKNVANERLIRVTYTTVRSALSSRQHLQLSQQLVSDSGVIKCDFILIDKTADIINCCRPTERKLTLGAYIYGADVLIKQKTLIYSFIFLRIHLNVNYKMIYSTVSRYTTVLSAVLLSIT